MTVWGDIKSICNFFHAKKKLTFKLRVDCDLNGVIYNFSSFRKMYSICYYEIFTCILIQLISGKFLLNIHF